MTIALYKFWTDCLHIVLGQTCSLGQGSLAFMCSHPVHKTVLPDPPPYTLIPCPNRFSLELGHLSRGLIDNSRKRNGKWPKRLGAHATPRNVPVLIAAT
jgi:hypothetical protein